MSSYDAGEATLRIVPSFAGVVEKISAQAAEWGATSGKAFVKTWNDQVKGGLKLPGDSTFTTQGAKSGGAFADGFKARVNAALRDLPSPNLLVDDKELGAQLADIRAKLEALGNVRIGIDIHEDEALAQLAILKAELDEIGAHSPSVQVRVDVGRASAELAAIQAQVAELDAEIAATDAEQVNPGVNGSGISSALQDVNLFAAAIVALIPLAAPVGAALTAAFAGVATTIGAVTAAAGVAYLGLSDVAKATQLLGQEQTAQATDAKASAAAARELASAQASLKSAQESLANAQRQAANDEISADEQVASARQSLADTEVRAAEQIHSADEQVASAENGLTEANQAAVNAQVALNNAREQAVRDLESYADAQVDANLNVTQAQLDLANAQAAVNADKAAGTQDTLQGQQDALNLAKAQQALVEAQQQAANATEDNTKAQQAGVDGAPGVVAATQQVTQAKYQQTSAEQALTDAETAQQQAALDAAESIKKAEQGVSDAVRQAANTQAEAAYSVQTAENSVADAARAVANAQTKAGEAGSSAVDKIKAKLDALNPATVAFAQFLRNSILPAITSLKNAAANGLLPGLEQGLQALTPLLGPLTSFVGSLATEMGNLAAQAGKALTSPFWVNFFTWVAATAGPTIDTFAHIVANIAKGFAGLLKAFSPVVTQLGNGLEHLSAKFAAFGANASNNKGFQSFLHYVETSGPQLVHTLEDVAGAFGHILTALEPLGSIALSIIGGISNAISSIPTPVLTILLGLISAIATVLLGAAGLIAAVKAWGLAMEALDIILDADPIVLLGLAIAAVGAAFYEAYKHIAPFREAVNAVFDAIKTGIEDTLNFVKDHWVLIVSLITGPIGLIVIELVKHWDTIKHDASAVVDAVVGFFEKLPDRLKTAVKDLGTILVAPFKWAFDEIGKLWNETVGRIHFHLPGWVPVLGGKGFSMPTVPGFGGTADDEDGVSVSQGGGPSLGWNGPIPSWGSLVPPQTNKADLASLNGVTAASASPSTFTGTLHLDNGAFVGQVTGVLSQKVTAAQQLEGAGMPGSSLSHLGAV